MYGLVLFTDRVLHVCSARDIHVERNSCSAKYQRRKYAARVLALHAKPNQLKQIKKDLESRNRSSTIFFLSHDYATIYQYTEITKLLDKKKFSKLYVDQTLANFFSNSRDAKNKLAFADDKKNFFNEASQFIAVESIERLQTADDQISTETEEGTVTEGHVLEAEEEEKTMKAEQVIEAEKEEDTIVEGQAIAAEKEEEIIAAEQAIDAGKKEETITEGQVKMVTVVKGETHDDRICLNATYTLDASAIDEASHFIAVESIEPLKTADVQISTEKEEGTVTKGNVIGAEEEENTMKAGQVIEPEKEEEMIVEGQAIAAEKEEEIITAEQVIDAGKEEETITEGQVEMVTVWKEEIHDDRICLNDTYALNLSALDISFGEIGEMDEINVTSIPASENLWTCIETFPETSEKSTSYGKPRVRKDEILSTPVILYKDPRLVSTSEAVPRSEERKNYASDYPIQSADVPNEETTLSESASFQKSNVINSTMLGSEIVEESEMSNDSDYVPPATSFDSDNADSPQDSSDEKMEPQSKNALNITLGTNKPGISAPDDADLMVANSNSATHCKRYFCFYCRTFQTKIARHMAAVHLDVEDVKKFSSLPPNNTERKLIIASLRKNGNHLYNNDKRFNTGELLVCRRPNPRMKKTAQDFIACGNCKGQYAKSVIRHHFRKCTKMEKQSERVVIVSGRKITARVHEKASSMARRFIFPYLREDSVVRAIRYDELMILFVNKQCERYGSHQHHFQMIRARARLLGRFLDAIKKIKPTIKTFAEVFAPRNYDAAIDAVRIVAGFDMQTQKFAHPSVASNLGTYLKYCGEILRSEYIKNEAEMEQKRVENFLKLQAEGFGTSINRNVAETQATMKRHKKIELPSTDDVKTFNNYITSERKKYYGQLKKKFVLHNWKKLAEATLLSLQTFNRRRPGEIERIFLEDFQNYQGIDSIANKETYAALTEEGKKLARTYVRFEIRGKLGRGVPVLVHTEIFDCIQLLIDHRENAAIPADNPYLFALPSTDQGRHRHLKACDLMRLYSKECGASLPDALRGTKLRKHIATRCINLNLSNGQVTDLANFMGHEEKIHKDIYRQPILETDIVGMSKILQIAQGQNNEASDSSENDSDDSESEHEQGKKSVVVQRGWTSEQRDVVLGRFATALRSNKMPSGAEMQKLINEKKCLTNKNVAQIRSWLHTQKKKGTF